MRGSAAGAFFAFLIFVILMIIPIIMTNMLVNTNLGQAVDAFNNFFEMIGGWFVWLIISLTAAVGTYIGIAKVTG